jgi:hypothetical protein
MRALTHPPYSVTETDTMNPADFLAIEHLIARHPKLRSDIRTGAFTGTRLMLFKNQIKVTASDRGSEPVITSNRCAFLFPGSDLFACRKELERYIRTAMRREPDGLFQFVLCPDHEEPLDLLDGLIEVIRSQPRHLIDRYAPVALTGKIASRRVMIQLPRKNKFSKAWISEAENLLAEAFF